MVGDSIFSFSLNLHHQKGARPGNPEVAGADQIGHGREAGKAQFGVQIFDTAIFDRSL
jgi:hypothetical protein